MKKHILTVLGYIFATFGTQGSSHFLFFSKHYSEISIMRPEPIFIFGFLSMVIQGSILSVVYERSAFKTQTLMGAVKLAWLFGFFLLSYIGLAEVGKYMIQDTVSWILIEFMVGVVQFTLIGVILGLVHRNKP